MQHVSHRAIAVIAALILAALAAAAPALAAPATVSLRIEGKSQTWFERSVRTDVRLVNGHDNSGPHTCDGTNGGQGGTPSPTAGTALADGSESSTPFSFVAKYFPPPGQGTDDFFLQTVQGETPDFNVDQTFWGFYLNGTLASTGMCQARVQQGDQILFAVVTGSETILSLSGPPTADVGQPVTFTVSDAANGSPVAGADVGGKLSDAGGHATLTFDSTGTRSFKATRPNAVRSNAVAVCVHQGDDGTCGTSGPAGAFTPSGAVEDRLPTARIVGIRNGQRFTTRTAPRLLRGHSDPGSAGLTAVDLRLRRAFAVEPTRLRRPAPRRAPEPGFTGRATTRCQFYSALFERFRPGRCDAGYFLYKISDRADWSYLLPLRPAAGRYVMDVVAVDRRGRRASARVRFTVVQARR